MAKNKIFLTVAILAASQEPRCLYLGFDGDAAREAYVSARNSPDPDVEEIRLIGQDYGVQKRWKAHSAAPTSEDDAAATPPAEVPKPAKRPGPKPKKEAKSKAETAESAAPTASPGDPAEASTSVS